MSNLIRVFVPEPTETPDEDDMNTLVVPDVTVQEALTLGIFAINTFMFPDASSEEDMATLDERGLRAVEVLAAIRDQHESIVMEVQT